MKAQTKPLIVLVFAPSAYPLGGVQTWLDYLVPGLRNKDMDVRLVLSEGRFHKPQTYLDFHPQLPQEAIITLSSKGTSQIDRVQSIKNIILNIKPDACLVVNMVDVIQAVNELRAKNQSDTRLISTLHGVHAGMLEMILHYRELLDAVISSNRLTQTLVSKRARLDPHRSLYAPYGVKTHRTLSKANSTSFSVAFVGRFEEDQKRISDLLKILSIALSQIDALEIHLAGDSDNRVVQEWLSEQAQYADQINDHGVLKPNELVEKVYMKADALLLTSEWETGPIVAWEAMSFGLTLISSRYIGAQHEGSLIDNKNCLLFDIGDCKEAVKQLKRAQDPKLRQKLNTNAAALIEQRYTISKSVTAWHQCILDSLKFEPQKQVVENIGRDKGRLNNLLGKLAPSHNDWLAAQLRKLVNTAPTANNAGSEWPHSYRRGEDSLVDLSDL